METLSATLFPWQEQPQCCPALPMAVLTSATFNSTTITSSTIAVNNDKNNNNNPSASFNAP